MINLSTVTSIFKVITASALALDVHASWVDLNGTTVTPGSGNTLITTATTTTVVGSPGSSTTRNVKTATFRNGDASSSNLITIQHYDGTNVANVYKVTLLAGETLQYNETDGWTVIDGSGGRKISPALGRLLRTTLLTSASGNHTVGADTNKIRIRGVGGGAGGAGCTSVAAAASCGGGGGAGGYAEKLFSVTPSTAYAYVCGALGAGASGALGGAGSDSTFIVGATTVTAKGGTGGPVATATTVIGTSYPGGAGGVVGTNGDVNASGQPGEHGIMTTVGPLGASGCGGSGPFGAGGVGIVAAGNGVAATGNGAGGGGAMTGASAVRTGGSGTAGCWVVDEYS